MWLSQAAAWQLNASCSCAGNPPVYLLPHPLNLNEQRLQPLPRVSLPYFMCRQLVEAFDEARARPPRAPPRRLLTSGARAQCKGRAADWSACDQKREAMDACIEPAERRRFRSDNECRRWRRLYQSCILESQSPTECDGRLQRFHKCVVGAVGE